MVKGKAKSAGGGSAGEHGGLDTAARYAVAKTAEKFAEVAKKALGEVRLEPGNHPVDVCLRIVGVGVQARHSDGKAFEVEVPAYKPDDILAGLLLTATGGDLAKVDAQIRAAIVALPRPGSEKKKDEATLAALATIKDVMDARVRDLQKEMGYSVTQSGQTAGRSGNFTCSPEVAIAATPEGLRGIAPRPVAEVFAPGNTPAPGTGNSGGAAAADGGEDD